MSCNFRLGYVVGNNPWKTIIISLIICALCLIGMKDYEIENRGFKNWVSQTSDAIKHKNWVDEVFPAKFRIVNVIMEVSTPGTTILTGDAVRKVILASKIKLQPRINNPCFNILPG